MAELTAKQRRELLQGTARLTQDAGKLFGDTSTIESTGTFALGQGLQSAGIGLGAYSALATLGPKGVAVAAVMAVGSYLLGAKKRRKQKEEMERRWREGLERYKERVKGLKQQTEQTESNINKAIGGGVHFDLLERARQDSQIATQLSEVQRGVIASTYKEERAAKVDVAAAEYDIFDTKLMAKLDLLDEAQVLAQKESEASRGVFGSYKTKYADEFQKKMEEFERL